MITGAGRLINEGHIIADVTGRYSSIDAAVFVNRGLIRALEGVTGYISSASWRNEGTVEAMPGASVFAAPPLNYVGGALIGGTWHVGANGVLKIQGADVSTLNAIVLLDGANASIVSGDNLAFALAGLSTIGEQGSLSLLAGRDITTASNLHNDGQLHIAVDSVLNVNGHYTQGESGELHIELAPDNRFGRVAVTNRATLDGELYLVITPGNQPNGGEAYRILTFNSHVGELNEPTIVGLGGGLRLEPTYTGTRLTINAFRNYLPGDANDDGVVDIKDLNAVRNTFGQRGPTAAGDTDDDEDVDLHDLNAVRNNFGLSLGGSPQPLPPADDFNTIAFWQSVIHSDSAALSPSVHQSIDALDAVFGLFGVKEHHALKPIGRRKV